MVLECAMGIYSSSPVQSGSTAFRVSGHPGLHLAAAVHTEDLRIAFDHDGVGLDHVGRSSPAVLDVLDIMFSSFLPCLSFFWVDVEWFFQRQQ